MFTEAVCVQVSLVQALVPRDEADEHSAILEVRAGGCRGGGHMQDDYPVYMIATGMITTQLIVTSHCLSNCFVVNMYRCRGSGGIPVCS